MKSPSLQKLTLCAALALAPALPSVAQSTTTPAPAAPAPSVAAVEEETFVLSPFEVNTSKDVGYLAGNTLAGSRLNTKLKDTAAAISVLTPEFLKDLGATSMKDVILFQNNAVPDFGDAANNVNGNPMIGNDEWQLRIRGQAASYARNYFKWDVSSDFYNVDRIDQSRGPNSILFGFGSPGGIVNTTTKQANVNKDSNEVSFTLGSWERYRGTVDSNVVLNQGKFAMRVNAVGESGRSWREFEFDRSRRADLAMKIQLNKESSLRFEGEVGRVQENVARPWLAFDQSSVWRAAGRPLFYGKWNAWSANKSDVWPNHRVVANDGVVRDWDGYAFANNATGGSAATNWNNPTWGAWLDTPENNAIIPRTANLGGPDAQRKTSYDALTAVYENKVNEVFSFELAVNHQGSNFKGYDPDGGRATNFYGNSAEIFGDASADLPDIWGNWVSANPNAGKLYIENNWTKRDVQIRSTELRATAALNFDTGDWAKHRLAGLIDYNQRTFSRFEYCEAYLDISGWPFSDYYSLTDPSNPPKAEFDVNRLYRRHYFTPGDVSDIHVGSWRDSVAGTGWVTNQPPEDTKQKQWTGMVALQSFFLDNKLVTIFGLRSDSMNYTFDIGADGLGTRDTVTHQYRLDPASARKKTFNANTLTAGAVYHVTNWLSAYANGASSRDLPEVRIHLVDSDIPPMPESKGVDVGLKFDLLDGKFYMTAGYYKNKTKGTTDWGDIQNAITGRNTRILGYLRNATLITPAEYTAHLINANGYKQDRDSSGWEFSAIANPTANWRISANFSINHVVAHNSMAEVKAWADKNSAFWLSRAPGTFVIDAWGDTLAQDIGWMNGTIGETTGLDGHEVRGQRQYGANLYNKYTFSNGALKGLYVGGGGRYQSANVAGFYYNQVRYGKRLILADAFAGYTIKTEFLGKGSTIDLQLNIANLLNTDREQIYTYAWWDPKVQVPGNIGLQEPRKFTFAATLHF